MTIYMQSTLELKAGDLGAFRAAMAELVAIVTAEGWELVVAMEQLTGRLHTVVDVWKLPDIEAYPKVLGLLRAHPRFPVIAPALAAGIERETVVIGVQASWG